MTPISWFERLLHGAEKHRAYFYRLAGTLSTVLVASGFVTDGSASKILFVIGAVLGIPTAGLAAVNTSTTPRKGE